MALRGSSPPWAGNTVAELARSLEDGSTTVELVARAFLDRIDADDPTVRAWVHVDPEAVLARARELDRVGLSRRGRLHGIPIGIKDIFDTHDMPTAYGSPIHAEHRPAVDAASVAIARRSGMLPLGKLVTTEFAAWPPGPTVNPHDVTRTPGGSSSGSAAAVAAGMVPVAFATQTTGSIIRPAAFCGVVGYKPSHGTLPTSGVKAISESFDTVGVIARTVADAAFVVGALCGRPLEPPPEPPAPRLGICLTHEWPAASPETVTLFDALPELLERAGARSTQVALPEAFAGLAAAQGTIWTFEIARCLADEHQRFRELIREPLRGMLDEGAAMAVSEYDAAHRRLRECEHQARRGLRRRRRVARPGRARRGARGRHDRGPDLQPGLVCARRTRSHRPGGPRAVGTASRRADRRPAAAGRPRARLCRLGRGGARPDGGARVRLTRRDPRTRAVAGVVTSGRVPPRARRLTPCDVPTRSACSQRRRRRRRTSGSHSDR